MYKIWIFVVVAILISMLSECEFKDTVELFKDIKDIPSVDLAM